MHDFRDEPTQPARGGSSRKGEITQITQRDFQPALVAPVVTGEVRDVQGAVFGDLVYRRGEHLFLVRGQYGAMLSEEDGYLAPGRFFPLGPLEQIRLQDEWECVGTPMPAALELVAV